MSEASPSKSTPSPSRGLATFFGGIGVIIADALVVAALLLTNIRPDTPVALGIWIVGGIGGLLMLLGVFLELINSLRTGRVRGLAVEVGILALAAACGYLGWTSWSGTTIPGDELATLLGKPRDDRAVQAAIKRLGPNHSENKDKRELTWFGHRLEMSFDEKNVLDKFTFGLSRVHPYRDQLPYGLSVTDKEDEVRRMLGEADSVTKGTTSETWHYETKGLVVVWSYGEGSDKVEILRVSQ